MYAYFATDPALMVSLRIYGVSPLFVAVQLLPSSKRLFFLMIYKTQNIKCIGSRIDLSF